LTFRVDPPEAATLFNEFQSGEASTLVKLGNVLGPFRVIAQSGSATAVFNLQVAISASALVVTSGNNQHLNPGGTTDTIVVRVNDAQGAGVANVPVTLSGPATMTLIAGNVSGNPITVNTGAGGAVPFIARFTSSTPVRAVTINASFSLGGRSGSTTVAVTIDPFKPAFTAAQIVNAGSFVAGLTPYGLATIFGTNLSPVVGNEFPMGATS